jgi:hypothetical protein
VAEGSRRSAADSKVWVCVPMVIDVLQWTKDCNQHAGALSDAVRTRAFVRHRACNAACFSDPHASLIATALGEARAATTGSATGLERWQGAFYSVAMPIGRFAADHCRPVGHWPRRVCCAVADGYAVGHRRCERHIRDDARATSLRCLQLSCAANLAPKYSALFTAQRGAAIGVVSVFGPAPWGFVHDLPGGYTAPLLVATALDIVTAIVVTSNDVARSWRRRIQ